MLKAVVTQNTGSPFKPGETLKIQTDQITLDNLLLVSLEGGEFVPIEPRQIKFIDFEPKDLTSFFLKILMKRVVDHVHPNP